jgi:hypothetical protein
VKRYFIIILLTAAFVAPFHGITSAQFTQEVTFEDSVKFKKGSSGSAGKVLTSLGNDGAAAWILPPSANAWLQTGNTGTTPGVNFIGTTDRDSLYFKVGGNIAGFLDSSASGSTSFGIGALNLSGTASTAIGHYAIANNSGTGNTAVGKWAMTASTSGNNNTAIGTLALQRVFGTPAINGSFNTALGYAASTIGNSPQYRTAIGARALVGRDSSIVLGDTLATLAVGIGTAYPQKKLHVVGDVLFKCVGQTDSATFQVDSTVTITGNSLWTDGGAGTAQFAISSGTITLAGAGGTSLSVSAGGTVVLTTAGGGASPLELNTLPAYDDDAAAAVAGLTANKIYQTTGAGAAPLNVPGILMIKQ